MNLQSEWSKSGFLRLDKFYRFLKDKDIKITRKEVNEFLNKQKSIQTTTVIPKPKIFPSILANNPGSNYQMDIMIYNRNEFNGWGAILGVIDVNSRYVQCVPLKSRKQKEPDSEVMKAITKIMKSMGYPENINTDNEFKSKVFLDLMKKHNVTLWFSYPDEITGKNAIIERFWRTLAANLRDYSLNTGKKDWNTFLQTVVNNYNNTYHGTVRGKPIDIWKGKKDNNQDFIIQKKRLSIGQLVRYALPKKTFGKADIETLSPDIYKIVREDPKRKNRWILMNINSNTELNKSYLERDLVIVRPDVVEPIIVNTRERVTNLKISDETKNRKKTKEELKLLQTDATSKFINPKDTKRKVKTPIRYTK